MEAGQLLGVGLEGLGDLDRELAGGGEDQGDRALGASNLPLVSVSFERIGSAKAAVLPVPVWAWPITSTPESTAGMIAAWMGEGCS